MDKGPISISITPGTVFVFFGVLLVLGLLYLLRDLVLILLAAIVISSAVEPGVQWFTTRRFPRALAVALVYGGTVGAFVLIGYFFFPPLFAQSREFIATIPQFFKSIDFDLRALLPWTSAIPDALSFLTSPEFLAQIQGAILPTGTGAFHALMNLLSGAFSFLLILVLSIYFTIVETGVDDFLRIIVPVKHQAYALDLWKRSHYKIGLWMQGQLILSAIIGVLGFLLLWYLNVPYALLIAIFAAFIEVVPVFGSIVSGTLATLIAAITGGSSTALLVAGGFLLINLIQSNLIYPLVVKKIVGVPPLMVVIAMIAGGSLAGVYGVLLAVPIAAALQEFISDFQKTRGLDVTEKSA